MPSGTKESPHEKAPVPPVYLIRAVEPASYLGRLHRLWHRTEVHCRSPRVHHWRYLGPDPALLLCQWSPVTRFVVPDRQHSHLSDRLDPCQQAFLPLQPLWHGRLVGVDRPNPIFLTHPRTDPGGVGRRRAHGCRNRHHPALPGIGRRIGHCGHHLEPEIQPEHGHLFLQSSTSSCSPSVSVFWKPTWCFIPCS